MKELRKRIDEKNKRLAEEKQKHKEMENKRREQEQERRKGVEREISEKAVIAGDKKLKVVDKKKNNTLNNVQSIGTELLIVYLYMVF